MRAFDLPGRSPVHALNGMAATSHPLASSTALSILKEGGNAVDAAIAAAATLAVVEPQSSGIGGDCFAILAEPDGTLHALNGSGRSPSAASLEWYLDHRFAGIGPESAHAVTAPGAVQAWWTLHQRFGRMDFARLFADAVGCARDGYAVGPRIAHDWKLHEPRLQRDPGARAHLLKANRSPEAGEIRTSPALAGVLADIAHNGPESFYRGKIAREIATTVGGLGAFLSEEDIAAVRSEWVEPIRTTYRGNHGEMEICEIPPNGQGLTALILLNLMGETGLPSDPDSAERYHLELELGRIAYAVRDAEIADPAHMRVKTAELLAPAFTRKLLSNYNANWRNDAVTTPQIQHSDTTYLSVVDRDRFAVSLINSLYYGFGSAIVTPQSGIILQNRGACFVVQKGHPNAIGPSKLPLHTIIPAMALKGGKAALSFGVMGGGFQPMGHAHVIADMLGYGRDPQEALDSARIFWNEAGVLEAERGISDKVMAGLAGRGWQVARGKLPHGGGQIIAINQETGVLTAGSDPRKDGHATGY